MRELWKETVFLGRYLAITMAKARLWNHCEITEMSRVARKKKQGEAHL